MSKEKRKAERKTANLFAVLTSLSAGETLGRGVVVDVSISGLAIDSEADLDIGNEVDCHVEIPLQIRAKVVRRYASGQLKRYGLRFLNQSIFDKFVLKRILKGSLKSRKVSL